MLERLHIAADAGFWPAAARAVCDFATGQGLPGRELQSIVWLVPDPAHALLAKGAMRQALSGAPFIPPRITPFAAWLGLPMQSGTAAQAELFTALRGNAWVRASFGAQPAALWALARGIARLCDDLSLAATDQSDAFAERLLACLSRHYHRRAARALQPQAQLVVQLWRARRGAGDAVERALGELDDRADIATTPLVLVDRGELDAQPAGWMRRFLHRYGQRAPVLHIVADGAAAAAARPLLAAAWPELAGGDREVPIAARADAISTPQASLAIVEADSLEEEAAAVAQQVLDWRGAGVPSIALVALDRLTARRARALLERAQVLLRDETGWKLSTTSAAAAVMRWFDLVADDLYWRDLLDWLKSKFTLAGRADKAAEVAFIERAIRAGGALQGARAVRRALADAYDGENDPAAAGAREVLALIEAQTQRAQRGGPTLAAHLNTLAAALDALGMRSALAADPVGAEVLREFDALAGELAGIGGRASLAEFRALLAERFEAASFVDRRVDSPVVMLSLAAAALRPFDAALLIGADARHLPSPPEERLFMSNAVRGELGLPTGEVGLRAQSAQLATLLASVPAVVATWRRQHGDEPNSLSPLLERLQFVAVRAGGGDLARRVVRSRFAVTTSLPVRPAPRAPQLMPARVSASHCQSLVHCAYQFYARRLLQLAELEDVIEMPEKRDFGEALHEVLERFHVEWGKAEFHRVDAAVLTASLAAHSRAVFEPQIERTPALLAFRRRFDRLAGGYVDWLQQQSQHGWRWQAGEDTHRQTLTLRGGREVELIGRIDRIDVDAGERLRVLDYKARAVDVLKRGLKVPGEDIQLPFYGMLLDRQAESATYVSFDRARDDRRGVESVVPPQPFDALVQAVATRLRSDLQRIADGVPLPAIGVESVCRHCEMRGLCRRDYWQKIVDGEGTSGSAGSEEGR
jgi:ATP-dependent helicase/nuclease subunit B